ncbi:MULTISPECIES: helix-turn-helix transcriptional regulator [Saccharothrix]|uniref:helix-turn-helix transcriptional regulator n=1 Tax=Saccharothrix TaxID=2071 RepID=UPI0018E97752|nr:helix-turn-helix transcriptional regulator [Saccharothrix sp. CB00851]
MHENIGEQFTIDDMARTANYSKFHFSRAFQRVTGVSPGRFLAAIRLQEAKRLLVSTSLTVTDISHRVGYTSVGTFSSRFRSSVGISPTTYRQLGGFAVHIPMARRAGNPRSATVQGEISAPLGGAHGLIFIGLFPDGIPQGSPIRCTVLSRPGPFVLTSVPPGTWHLLAHSVALGHESMLGDGPFSDGLALSVASSGPITIRPGVPVRHADLTLRPIRVLDPPVLLALLDVRTVALGAGAAS